LIGLRHCVVDCVECFVFMNAAWTLDPYGENEEAVRDLRRTAFSSRCRPIAGSPKRRFVKPKPVTFDETRASRLIATALFARDCPAAPFDRSGYHAAVLPRADGNTAWPDADGSI
jgi:hypothetical protein